MPRNKKKSSAPSGGDAIDGHQCIICMTLPKAGEGAHRCETCKPDAWAICSNCDAAIAGKPCPVCRKDYARQKAEWEEKPPETTKLEINTRLSQAELARLSATFPHLKELVLCDEYDDEEEPQLEFSAAGVAFPALTQLTLVGTHLKSITFTTANTPLLKSLSLDNVMGECCPFHLSLPHLTHFSAEHTMLGERPIDAGQFGLSLSRCPKLEVFSSYKFRMLGESNFLVLPSMRSMRLHRAECLSHLDIVYAPKLEHLSMQAAWDCRDFVMRHVPSATAATIESLIATLNAAHEAAADIARAEDARWRAQGAHEKKLLTKEARRRGWIERDEKWQVAAEMPGGDGESDDDPFGDGGYDGPYEEILMEHCSEIGEKEFRRREKAALADAFPPSTADASLPRLTIDAMNGPDVRVRAMEACVQSRLRVVCAADGDMMDGGHDDFGFEGMRGFGGDFGGGFGGFGGPPEIFGRFRDDDEDDADEEEEDDDDEEDEEEDGPEADPPPLTSEGLVTIPGTNVPGIRATGPTGNSVYIPALPGARGALPDPANPLPFRTTGTGMNTPATRIPGRDGGAGSAPPPMSRAVMEAMIASMAPRTTSTDAASGRQRQAPDPPSPQRRTRRRAARGGDEGGPVAASYSY